MKCPRCGHEITCRRKRCEICGQDLSIYERLQRISNSFYNKGLERAKVRDLTGAIEMLKKSLELNKENTNARNLLGLVYFEMGEVVAALGEWVISKHFNPLDQDAERLINKVQSDTVAFDSMNQTIKKYNIALQNAKRQDDDLAILQLKRVISMNPKYVRALLLLALVYLKNCEYEKARRCLVRVQKIDVGNVQALRYMEEIRLHTEQGTQGNAESDKENNDFSSNPQFVPVHSYKEDKPNFMAFLTFFLGVVIGVAIIYYMAVPNIRRSILEEYNQKEKDYSVVINAKNLEIASLESNINILHNTIEDLEGEVRFYETEYVFRDYGPLVEVLLKYEDYLLLPEPTQAETEALAAEIEALDMSSISLEAALELYDRMKEDISKRAAAAYTMQGILLYGEGKHEDALPVLETAYVYTPDDPEVLYHLGRIYHSLGDMAQAKLLYEMILANHSDSQRYQEAEVYLGYILEWEAAQPQ